MCYVNFLFCAVEWISVVKIEALRDSILCYKFLPVNQHAFSYYLSAKHTQYVT